MHILIKKIRQVSLLCTKLYEFVGNVRTIFLIHTFVLYSWFILFYEQYGFFICTILRFSNILVITLAFMNGIILNFYCMQQRLINPSLSAQPMSNIFKEMTTIHDDCVLVGDRDWAHSIPIFASQWEMNLINHRDSFSCFQNITLIHPK